MTYYTALDVSLRSVSVCIVDDQGEVRHEAKVGAEVDKITACLRAFSPEVSVIGFEAGALTQYLTYGLQAEGFDVICLEARQVSAALSAMRNKTDRNDARGIAQILRTGWYSRVHVKSLQSHQLRVLLSRRKAILSKCVDLENELRGLLKIFGVRLASKVAHGGYDSAVRPLVAVDPLLARGLLPLLEARLVLYKTYLKLDNEVKAITRTDPICKRLMTVPGVGAITALTFKAAVDDPARFKSSRTVAAHFGLTPRRYQSGETDNPGRISKAGDPDVRCALYTAAHALMTRTAAWSSLKVWGIRLAKTRGHRRAVIAVARKLAVILHKMWINGADFRWASVEATA
jgi:transposase